MNFAFLLSALLHFFNAGGFAPDVARGVQTVQPPDTSGAITGARVRQMDTSGVLTGAKVRQMDTSGILTGSRVRRVRAMDTSGVITG